MTPKQRDALELARDKFKFYGEQHRAKLTDANRILMMAKDEAVIRDKALANEVLTVVMQEALDDHDVDADINTLEKVQDYRFGSLTKGQHYAFARGLVIAPTHLPLALDAMLEDGWELDAVFGQTDAKSIGFIFKRVGPRPTDPSEFSFEDCIDMHHENERLHKRVNELLGANNVDVERRRAAERRLKEFQEGTPPDQIK